MSEFFSTIVKKLTDGVYVSIVLNQKFPTGWMKKRVADEFKRLSDAGVQIKWANPTRIQHAKILIVDRKTVYLGSVNLTTESFERNNEILLEIDDPIVVERCVEHFFNEQGNSKILAC